MNSIDPSYYRGSSTSTSASLPKLKKDKLSFLKKAFMRLLLKPSKAMPTQQYMKSFGVEMAGKHGINTCK